MKKFERKHEPPRLILESQRAVFPKIEFDSVTKRLVHLSNQQVVQCPKCGKAIDFNSGLEWYGPSHFMCANCNNLVNLATITKEYRNIIFR